MGVDPMMLLQNIHVINGRPGMEAKFAIALCNSKGVFKGPIRYELKKDNSGKPFSCTAWAIDKETGERVEEYVDMDMARAEGWTNKEGSKWKTIPSLMLKYRSAMWLIRTTCPEVLMGMRTVDEIEDIDASETIDPVPAGNSNLDRLSNLLSPKSEDDSGESEYVIEVEAEPAVAEFAPKHDETAASYVKRIRSAISSAVSDETLSDILETAQSYAGSEVLPEEKYSALQELAAKRLEEIEVAKANGQLV